MRKHWVLDLCPPWLICRNTTLVVAYPNVFYTIWNVESELSRILIQFTKSGIHLARWRFFLTSVAPLFHTRKLVSLLVLLAFCIATLPLPILQLDLSPSDDSTPYPCQSCHCGCKSAFQCWTSCCCHTPEERLEWAEKNGVTPPSYAILKSPATLPVFAATSQASKPTSCCHNPNKSCCTSKNCEPASDAKAAKCAACEKKLNKKNQRWVFILDALKCQGKSSSFSVLPWTIIAKTITWNSTLSLLGMVESPVPILFVDSSLEPATPPPRG